MTTDIPAFLPKLDIKRLRYYIAYLDRNLYALRKFGWCVDMHERWTELRAYAGAELNNRETVERENSN